MELLVAVAIFVTVMASVALVFNGAIRTSKQGFQNQEAYELARGAMKVIERDLSRAFTNRNHGDAFNFYGTPIGFTYVGLISADESSAPNMARVTYAVYHDFASVLAGSVAQYDSKDGVSVPLYALLRIVEPGQDTLDSFPVPWNLQANPDSGAPETFEQLVQDQVLLAGCPDVACEDLIEQAARREIWIRLISGGDALVASGWDEPALYLGLDNAATPNEYFIAENLRYLDIESFDTTSNVTYCANTQDDLENLMSSLGFEIDYDDVLYQSGTQSCVLRVNSSGVAPMFDDTTPAIFSTSDGLRPFFTYWDIGVQEFLVDSPEDLDIIPDNVNTADDKVGQIAFQFWNDWRNLVADGLDSDGDNAILSNDGLDNDGDTVIDEPNEGVDEPDERYAENAGSPLDTRLPVAVTVDLTLFFRSPYPGAPDFNERFTQRIDLPVAYRRAFKQRVPDATP